MKVFILEDDPHRINCFWEAGVDHDLTVTESVEEAIQRYNPPYDLMLLDHDLGGLQMVDSNEPNTGTTFVKWLIQQSTQMPSTIIIHSYNPVGARTMHSLLDGVGAKTAVVPFGFSVLKMLGGGPWK